MRNLSWRRFLWATTSLLNSCRLLWFLQLHTVYLLILKELHFIFHKYFFFLHQKSFICSSFLFLALQISLISVGKATVWLIGSISSGVRSYRLKENTHWHDINPVTFPSWASLMAFPVDVVLRRLFPPNVLRPDIRLVRPTGPWAGPPGGGPPTDAAAAGPTVRPSSSVTKKVDHMLWWDGKQLRQSSEFGSWACFELFPRRGRKQKLKTGTKTEENCCVLSVCAH